jgi:two-component system chemotaxis response regulator CheB
MKPLRVLVVDDSLTVRKHIASVLSHDPEVEVVGEANSGRQAIELCDALRPDVMTLDMMLPELSGLEVTEHVMAFFPTPILIVSASLNRGEVFRTFDALAAGAVDVLDKPAGRPFDPGWGERLVQSLKVVSRVPVITHPRRRLTRDAPPRPGTPTPPVTRGQAATPPALIAIGASTGGPSALATILRGLPPTFPIPLAIVVHIGGVFLTSFVEWLDEASPIRVRLAEHGQPLPLPGEPRALVAPADRHLVLRRGALALTSDPERHSCRPSIDVFFESVASEMGPRAMGCLLTGMGKDGAAGLLAMRNAGARTLAQDEGTSVVFGMPSAAIRLGAVDKVLPLGALAPELIASAFQADRVC